MTTASKRGCLLRASLKYATASFTSTALPADHAKGTDMSVNKADVVMPAPFPTSTMLCAKARALSLSCMTAPLPHLTSSTKCSRPAANFFDTMDAVMSPMCSTVAVTSRVAYMRRSAGAKSSVCLTIANPCCSTTR